MKKMKHIILSLFTVAMLVLSVDISAEAVAAEDLTDQAQVTRAEWLSKLVEVFEMTVEDDVYPDNYFSDLNSESEYYYDILLAVEFGVVDVPAGGEVRPDDPVTREEAVTTLNFCLGFELGTQTVEEADAEEEYTFNDEADLAEGTNPDDVQIALNRGWVELIDGAFSPSTELTGLEVQAMLDDAAAVLAAEVVDEDYENVFELADDVIVASYSAVEVAIDESSVTLTDLATELEVGDKFAVYENGVPFVAEAAKITEVNNVTVIAVNEVADEDAYKNIDAQGVVDVDYTEITTYNDAEIVFIDNETGEEFEDAASMYAAANARATVKLDATIKVKEKVSLGSGLSATVEATIKNAKIHYGIDWSKVETYAYLTCDADVSYTIKGDLAQMAGLDEILILTIGAPGVGGLDLYVNLEASGSISTVTTYYVKSGVGFTISDGFRQIKSFKNKAFSVVAEATAGVGATFKLGVTQLPVINAYIYADGGARIGVKHFTHEAGTTPSECVHFAAYVYADYGATASVDFGIFGSWEKTLECVVYDEDNSPYRIVHHYEDGAEVASCTMGHGDPYGYFTTYDSTFCGSGYGRARSQGLTRSGEPVIIYSYTTDDEGNATITGYSGNATSLVIPSTIDGHTVVAIGGKVFSGNKMLRSVRIPDTVTSIGNSAFNGCTSLNNINLPDELISLGNYAFRNCISLASINVPKTLTNIDTYGANYWYPFTGCSGLHTIDFEEGITAVPYALFGNCTGLKEVTIPDTVTVINSRSFAGCTNLVTIKIPDCVTGIGASAFNGCTNLKNVSLPKMLESIGNYAFRNCTSIKKINIPKFITNVETYGANYWYPFTGCTELSELEFEAGITNIPYGLLGGCTGLVEITIPDTVTVINSRSFASCTGLETVNIPDCVTTIGASAFTGCAKLKNVILPKQLSYIGNYAFKDCISIETINVPKALTTVETYGANYWYPFTGCTGVKEITIEDGCTKIPDCLFGNCYGALIELVIPEGVTEIGTRAFEGCTNLKAVSFPNSLTTIGDRTFANTNISEIVVPDTVISMGSAVFTGCTELKEVKLPNIRINITESMFKGCTSLEEITLPDTVTSINNSSFENCTSLKKVNWSKSIDTIANSAFANCDALVSIEIPETVTSIGANTFYDCDALEKILIPDSVTSIGQKIFYDCDLLSDVKLGTGITTIPTSVFEHCDVLETLVLPYRVSTIGANAFKDCVKLVSITIPRSTTSIVATAFSYPEKITIYGVSGTYAETFATDNDIKFVANEINATAVTLDQTALQLTKGASEKLVMSITPSDFTDEVSWKSSDENIVTITDTGLVTAKNVGTVTIKVVVGSVSASCKVTVVQPVTGISLNKTSLSMEALSTYQLTATVKPTDAYNQEVVWSSSDEAVATVDQTGLVTTVSKGTATITVAAQDGSGKTAVCKVTVINNGYAAESAEELESPHNYEVNCTDFWEYTRNGAEALAVTFDERTEIEDGFDYLYIYDGEGNQFGKYTGTELARTTITVTGDTVKIQLSSDDSGTAWGFKVTSAEAVQLECEHEYGDWTTVTEPTEEEAGLEKRVCGLCGDEETREIEKLEHVHSYGEWEVYDGEQHVKYCKCKDEQYEAHAYGDWTVIKEPTYTEEGEEERLCDVCGYGETRAIEKLPEKPVEKLPFTDVPESAWYYSYVKYVYENGLMAGTGAGTTFSPLMNLSRSQFATILWRINGSPVVAYDDVFTDVPEGKWYTTAVIWASENGVVKGYKDGSFGINDNITREQMALMMYRYAESKGYDVSQSADLSSFSDYDEVSGWAETAVKWAVANKIINGKNGDQLDPWGNATRAECATIIKNYMEKYE